MKNFRVPTASQSAQEWANENKLSGTFADYREVCKFLNITCHKTQSGKVALTQRILAERKKAKESVDVQQVITEEQTTLGVKYTLTEEHMQTHTPPADTAQGAAPATADAVTAATLLQQAIGLLGIQSQGSHTLTEGQMQQVLDLIKSHSHTVTTLRVENTTTETTKDVGVCHNELPRLIKLAQMRINLYLHGPAGTGKSFIAEQIANALDLPFGCMSFCGQSTKTDLVGYMDAHGKYVSTVFYDIYKNGGIFCLDEMDAANPNLINLLNGGLAGGQMSFPCGMVKRHPDFVCVASANTFGTGSTEQYIGRNPLDAASLDRFQKVTIDYCQNLERGLYSATACEMVWEERKRLQGRTGYVLSMRTIGRIDQYLAAGYSAAEAYEMAINSHLNQNLRK
jgi:hypothetical protein